MPPSLRDVILDFYWHIERLQALELPTRTVATSALTWHLNLPFWSANGAPFQVSPNEVAANPSIHQQHWQRTHAADLQRPLDAYRRRDSQIVILDGIHRLMKASLLNRASMTVRVLLPHQFDDIAMPGPSI